MSGQKSRLRLGWLGTGRMGFAMASRLASAGNDVAVWNRTRAKAEPLTSSGAAIVDQISDLADRDVVFTVVGNSADFEDVTTGPTGLLSCSWQGAAHHRRPLYRFGRSVDPSCRCGQ